MLGLAGALGLDGLEGRKGSNRLTIFWKNPPCPLTMDKVATLKKRREHSLMMISREESEHN